MIRPRLEKYQDSRKDDADEDEDDEDFLPPSLDLDKEGPESGQKDFLDVSLEHHLAHPKSYPWDVSVYEVMDLIGGHSAVGNLLMRLLGWVSLHPEAQERIRMEGLAALAEDTDGEGVAEDTDGGVAEDMDKGARSKDKRETRRGEKMVRLHHRSKMPFTDAAILETLRLASSPIVPHVANRSTTLAGFDVDEGTMILFNTYHLNMSNEYWKCPKQFRPERFLIQVPIQEDSTGLTRIKYSASSSSLGSNCDSSSTPDSSSALRSTSGLHSNVLGSSSGLDSNVLHSSSGLDSVQMEPKVVIDVIPGMRGFQNRKHDTKEENGNKVGFNNNSIGLENGSKVMEHDTTMERKGLKEGRDEGKHVMNSIKDQEKIGGKDVGDKKELKREKKNEEEERKKKKEEEERKEEEEYWNQKWILEPGFKFQVSKPDHFFPFSFGRRACLGYKMVTFISFSILANLCLKYKLLPVGSLESVQKQLEPKGSLALSPDDCFQLQLIPRS